VRGAVVGKRDMHATIRERCTTERNKRYSPRHAVWILDDDIVA
jgi:hypothetical protein